MCRNPARLATALAVCTALVALAQPASAGLFGSSKPATSAKAEAPPQTQPQAAPAKAEASRPSKASPQERAEAERLEPLARAAFWTREVQVDPTDAEAGVALARALRAMGQYDQAAQAAQAVLVVSPKNVEALLEDARAKIGANQGFYAIASLEKAKGLAPKDWRPYSLLGVALEQSERPEEAREAYQEALKLSPENTAVLSNLGLFYAGRGDKAQAEALMRRAVARPDSGAAERQNLALILGLEGKLPEAEKLIRQDLPPDQAKANLAYLQAVNAPPEAHASTTANLQAATTPRNWTSVEQAEVRK